MQWGRFFFFLVDITDGVWDFNNSLWCKDAWTLNFSCTDIRIIYHPWCIQGTNVPIEKCFIYPLVSQIPFHLLSILSFGAQAKMLLRTLKPLKLSLWQSESHHEQIRVFKYCKFGRSRRQRCRFPLWEETSTETQSISQVTACQSQSNTIFKHQCIFYSMSLRLFHLSHIFQIPDTSAVWHAGMLACLQLELKWRNIPVKSGCVFSSSFTPLCPRQPWSEALLF